MLQRFHAVHWVLALVSMFSACPAALTAQETSATLALHSKPFPMLPEAAARLQESFGSPRVLRWPSESRTSAGTFSFSLQAPSPSTAYSYRAHPQPEYAARPNKNAAHHADALDEYSRVIPGAAPLVTKIREQMKDHPQLTRVMKLLAPAP